MQALHIRIPNTNAFLSLLSAVIAGSFAGVFIKFALQAGAPVPLVVAARLFLAALVLTPIVLRNHRQELLHLQKKDILIAGFAGFWLALHFLWMAYAIENTSILIVQVIINTGPIWVAFLEVTFLHTRLPRIIWIGSFLTLIGGTIIALGSGTGDAFGGNALYGAALALISALASATYLTIGRHVRSKVSLLPYIWVVFSAGSITAIIAVIATGTSITGYDSEVYLWLVLITLLPQLIGHAGFNYALGFLPATIVAISAQLISVTAPIVAYFAFAEVPVTTDIIGSMIIMGSVLLTITRKNSASPAQSKP
jgi:drug/metabolite transporter (DMT)-like permease